jgi:predicted chitinase
MSYPSFINYAISIGNVSSVDEMAQFYAQILYQSNGFMLTKDPACYNETSANCQALGLETQAYGVNVNYFGRGYLWLQGASAYRAANADLFGKDVTLLVDPDIISRHRPLNFATSAWFWKTFVAPGRTNFGSTTAILRPTTCNGSPTNPTASSVSAWNVYVAVLKVLSPSSIPSSGFC